MTDNKFEKEKAVYDQDWNNCRYQDQLRWSRFKTISLIEGAFLYGSRTTNLESKEILYVLILGTILVFIVSALAIKDESDARSHIERTKRFEDSWEVEELVPQSIFYWLKGWFLMSSALFVLNVFNIVWLVNFLT